MYKHLLFDADNTLLDFNAGERCALQGALNSSPLEFSEEVYKCYHEINASLWKDLERGEIERKQLRILRFERLFDEFGLDGSVYSHDIDGIYLEQMKNQAQVFDGVWEVLDYLHVKYKMHIITNASVRVQKNRLTNAGFHKYFEKYYISEEIGTDKPGKDFFDHVVSDIGDDLCSYLVIGDSLSSDIKGAIISGIDSCYLDHSGKGAHPFTPQYIIRDIRELIEIL